MNFVEEAIAAGFSKAQAEFLEQLIFNSPAHTHDIQDIKGPMIYKILRDLKKH